MAGIAGSRAGGSSENVRHEEPPNRLGDDIPTFDDDITEYGSDRMTGSQAELQKLWDQVESVTHKMRGKHVSMYQL